MLAIAAGAMARDVKTGHNYAPSVIHDAYYNIDPTKVPEDFNDAIGDYLDYMYQEPVGVKWMKERPVWATRQPGVPRSFPPSIDGGNCPGGDPCPYCGKKHPVWQKQPPQPAPAQQAACPPDCEYGPPNDYCPRQQAAQPPKTLCPMCGQVDWHMEQMWVCSCPYAVQQRIGPAQQAAFCRWRTDPAAGTHHLPYCAECDGRNTACIGYEPLAAQPVTPMEAMAPYDAIEREAPPAPQQPRSCKTCAEETDPAYHPCLKCADTTGFPYWREKMPAPQQPCVVCPKCGKECLYNEVEKQFYCVCGWWNGGKGPELCNFPVPVPGGIKPCDLPKGHKESHHARIDNTFGCPICDDHKIIGRMCITHRKLFKPSTAIKTEETVIIEAIKHSRAVQDYLWGWANKEWGIEEWRRMLRKRVEKLDELDPSNPHYNVELRKRVLQTAALSVALLTEMEKRNIKDGVHPSVPSNLPQYSDSKVCTICGHKLGEHLSYGECKMTGCTCKKFTPPEEVK